MRFLPFIRSALVVICFFGFLPLALAQEELNRPEQLYSIPSEWMYSETSGDNQSLIHQFSLLGNQYAVQFFSAINYNGITAVGIPIAARFQDNQLIPITNEDELRAVLLFAKIRFYSNAELNPDNGDYWRELQAKTLEAADSSDPSQGHSAILFLRGGQLLLFGGLSMLFPPADSLLVVIGAGFSVGSTLSNLIGDLAAQPGNNEMVQAIRAANLADANALSTFAPSLIRRYVRNGFQLTGDLASIPAAGIDALTLLIDTSDANINQIGVSLDDVIAGRTSLPQFLGKFHLSQAHEIVAAAASFAVVFGLNTAADKIADIGSAALQVLISNQFHYAALSALAGRIASDQEKISSTQDARQLYYLLCMLEYRIDAFYRCLYELSAVTLNYMEYIRNQFAGSITVSQEDIDAITHYMEQSENQAVQTSFAIQKLADALSLAIPLYETLPTEGEGSPILSAKSVGISLRIILQNLDLPIHRKSAALSNPFPLDILDLPMKVYTHRVSDSFTVDNLDVLTGKIPVWLMGQDRDYSESFTIDNRDLVEISDWSIYG